MSNFHSAFFRFVMENPIPWLTYSFTGILIIKRKFVTNSDPGNCGGGSENYRVDDDKGELGMSTIMESIRTGLVLQLKEAIGTEMIESKNKEICQRAMDRWRHNPYLLQLGPRSQKTIPMFSFLVIHPESKTFLHHNFVAILLNDLYGIQAYGGCGNAGPYMEDLLEIDDELSRKLNKKLTEEKIRTGCTSVYISYVLPNHTVDFVLGAVDQVAKHGWKLLPLYEYNTSLGVWKHRHFQFSLDSLKDIRYKLGGMKVNNNSISQHFRAGKETLREILAETSSIFEEAYLICKNSDAEGDPKLDIEEEQRDLIWFLQPSQALRMLKSKTPRQPIKLEELVDFVFFPRTFVSDEEENAIRASFVTSPGNDSGNAGTDSDTTSDSLTDEEEEDEERPRSNYKPVMTSFLESRLRQNSARAPDSPVETRDVAPPDDTQESKNSKTKKPVIKPKNYKKHVQRMLSYGYLTRYNVRKEYNSSPEVMNSFTRLPPINKQDKRTNISKS
ncbi:uncharacterized protein LOC106161982 [Lingula anatina]|uniref:Uncharacterized protein LOC106161982 n=1 Tax=Lingula anatina TaxID=7574 RepID=A0A1S3I9I5_LINAN|nr:uncharacterized protein LOC106161982 [Lingula anatina]|eukprot:XP_013394521.1 uncharacterized protein LOC106161982 [Lingula anatina]